MKIDKNDTALVVIDPQNDVLSEHGVSRALVGDSVKENNTVENIARLFRAAKDMGFEVFISPHYLYYNFIANAVLTTDEAVAAMR
jgi:nicotinamidase-related amidase